MAERENGEHSGYAVEVNVAALMVALLALDSAPPHQIPVPDAGAVPPTLGSTPRVPKPPPSAPEANDWNAQRTPADGPPGAIGTCSCGCLKGAEPLPVNGQGYEVLHVGRNRRFGHPALIAYVRRLAAASHAARLGLLVVGDLSQPRGGPTPTGHRSHQSGLDADIGYAAPKGARAGRLSAQDRERLSPPAVVDLVTHRPTSAWGPNTVDLLALAAGDPVVDRIFVNPAIKRMLCEGPARTAPWQLRIRSWWGHHDHFHVRLKCPFDSPLCVSQDPPPDDGCGASLVWWFSADAEATRSKRKTAEEQEPGPQLPEACAALIAPNDREVVHTR